MEEEETGPNPTCLFAMLTNAVAFKISISDRRYRSNWWPMLAELAKSCFVSIFVKNVVL